MKLVISCSKRLHHYCTVEMQLENFSSRGLDPSVSLGLSAGSPLAACLRSALKNWDSCQSISYHWGVPIIASSLSGELVKDVTCIQLHYRR